MLVVVTDKFEQCACIKFCVKLKKSTTKTLKCFFRLLMNISLDWTQVFEWHTHFKTHLVSVQGDQSAAKCQKMWGKIFIRLILETVTVHREFVSSSSVVNFDFYCNILRFLRDVQWRRLELCCNHCWLLYRDNGPTHTSLKTMQFVIENNMAVILYPPYSPDTESRDFTCFPEWSSGWRMSFQHRIIGSFRWPSGRGLPWCFWGMEDLLRSLCVPKKTVLRGILTGY